MQESEASLVGDFICHVELGTLQSGHCSGHLELRPLLCA